MHTARQSASRPIRATRAFVTLVTNSDFARGARVLMKSLIRTGTRADLVVMHTDAVTEADLAPLRALGVRLVRAEHLPLSAAFNAAHARDRLHGAAPFTKGTKPAFHTPLDNFIKLRLWQLDYDTCVFLDSDTLVVQNIDRLFDYPQFSAAPNVYESLADFHRMNSGVFVASPCERTFRDMLDRLEGRFWKRTDQTFLQEMFPDWHGLPIFYNMLQYSWINLPDLWDWDHVKIVHYQYEKPWEKGHARAQQLRPLIDLWHAYEQDRAPNLPRAA
ncbi:glycosyltransferase [Tropicibacter alexandrii]|uniref:glycosyltransferase n=1 Tax=Tropicibacter alexandrii TaxID=2267683 RepID=UPI000EF52AFD|nr:glycosyltransferase family 8 protein [Tropicibacter alexandrii]